MINSWTQIHGWLISKTESLTSYEVVIDVFGQSNDLFAYGILTVPNDIIKGQQDPGGLPTRT